LQKIFKTQDKQMKLKSCKKSGKEKNEFEFKEQENVKDFIEQQESRMK
jgi:hypothetical protein